MSIQTDTIRAVTMDNGTIRREIGDSGDLIEYVRDKHVHVYIIGDDDAMADGFRVLADGWYDAAVTDETPTHFALRLFGMADERAGMIDRGMEG